MNYYYLIINDNKMNALLCTTALYGSDRILRKQCGMFRYPIETSNRMVCIGFQWFILYYVLKNLYTDHLSGTLWKNSLQPKTIWAGDYMAGYFLYDLLILFSSARGRKQYLFIVHHLISVFLCSVNKLYPCGNDVLNNSIILILELSSPWMNLWKICEEIDSKSFLTRFFFLTTRFLFGISRMGFMTLWLMYYLLTQYQFNTSHTLNLGGFLAVYVASIKWYMAMLRK
jgi:hypothetical protein